MFEQLKAAVDAANSWNTYVCVHANTDASIRMAIAAGVRFIEHGVLLEEDTLKLMADKGVWLSIQPLRNDEDAFKFTGENQRKWIQVTDGTDELHQNVDCRSHFGSEHEDTNKEISTPYRLVGTLLL